MHFVMQMATPTQVNERVTFKWNVEKTYAHADPAGRPYAWNQTPSVVTAHDDVQVDCVIEFSARPAGSRDTPFGQFDTSRAVISLLDDDFPTIQGANTAVINGNTYDIQFVGPAITLFDMDMYQLFCEARDET